MEISEYSDSSNWSQGKMKLSLYLVTLEAHCFPEFQVILHLNASLQGLMLHQAVPSPGFSEPSGRSGGRSFAAPVLICPSSRGLPRLVFNSQTRDPVELWSSFSVALVPSGSLLHTLQLPNPPSLQPLFLCLSQRPLAPLSSKLVRKVPPGRKPGQNSQGSQFCMAVVQCLKTVPYIFDQFLILYSWKASPVSVTPSELEAAL